MKILAIDKILFGATEGKIYLFIKEVAKGWELHNAGVFSARCPAVQTAVPSKSKALLLKSKKYLTLFL